MQYKQKVHYLTPEQIEGLRELAYKTRLSESEIVRQAIDNYLQSEGLADDYTLSGEARQAVDRIAEDKNVPVPKVIEATFRRQLAQYYKEV